jgi:hypothetical protein
MAVEVTVVVTREEEEMVGEEAMEAVVEMEEAEEVSCLSIYVGSDHSF